MGNLIFTTDNLDNYEIDRVARTLLGEFWARGAYDHILRYHADIFIDYEAFAARLNVSGLYFIREMGTHTIFLEKFRSMSGEQKLPEYAQAMIQLIGSRMTRAFLILDRKNETKHGCREIVVREFDPSSKCDLETIVKILEGVKQ